MNLKNFYTGIKKGTVIALGYIPIAITFGLIASSYRIPKHISIMMSSFVFAGASQFIAINLLNLGIGYWEIIITTFVVNLRHFLMSASISQKIKKNIPKKWMSLISFGITDETFSIISLNNKEDLTSGFILGVNITAYMGWVSGTFIGVFMGKVLPDIIQKSMGIALYAMFIGLLVPSIKRSRPIFIVSLITFIISSFLHWGPLFLSSISKGWKIILITIIASTIGTLLYPEGVENNE